MLPVRFASWMVCAALGAVLGSAPPAATADGLSNYLPLNLEPETERLIERVLILADEPILKRPFPVKLVEDALPQACEVDPVLCARVKRYLQRYSRDYALTHASLTVSKTKGSDPVLPNSYGETARSKWELSGQAFVQPNDYLLANVGGVAYSGRSNAAGSFLSFGFNWAQIDIGYRDHWLSPMTDSSTLVSTEAPVTPSVTISNSEPITRLGFQYEFFLTELSSTPILYDGVLSNGRPRVFGTQLSIEPIPGWSLGINRLLQYGGGSGLPRSAHFLLSDFFKPSGLNQSQGNQQASYVSRFIYPGKTPFAIYAQYAGEDNSDGGSYLLGNTSLSVGIDLPRIGPYFDATFEIAEWQNIWYVHNIFLDGMSNDGRVLGNWGADQRNFGDGVGARSLMLRVGWVPEFGGYLEERVRTLANETYFGGDSRNYQPQIPAFPYHKYRDLMVRYTRPWKDLTLGGEFLTGKDIDGKSFSRLSGFVRYGGDERTRDDGGASAVADDATGADKDGPKGAEVFVDAGVNANQVRVDLEKGLPITTTKLAFGPHLGFGARRAVTDKGDLGARIELDDVNGHTLIGFRAVDYRHRYDGDFPVTLNLFLGAARYGLATPAMSLYAGIGTTWRNILPKWDLTLDARYAQNVARDHVLASDPQGVRPESFYKISSAVLYASRRF